MDQKIVGYILLTVGIVTIVITGINVYMVFTGNVQPINPFETPGISFDLGSMLGLSGLPGAENIDTSQELLDANSLNQMFNFTAHLLLMGFLASVGYKLAKIGSNLVRPIVVRAGNRQVLKNMK